jgi:hypothetical protein
MNTKFPHEKASISRKLTMKKISTLLLLLLGFSTITLAQKNESQYRSLEDLKNSRIQVQKPLLELSFTDTLRFDPPIIFSPENPFPERTIITFPITQEPIYSGRIYALPDPQSRMPLMPFPEKQHYNLLIKEYE